MSPEILRLSLDSKFFYEVRMKIKMASLGPGDLLVYSTLLGTALGAALGLIGLVLRIWQLALAGLAIIIVILNLAALIVIAAALITTTIGFFRNRNRSK
jgi:hypothetical protein